MRERLEEAASMLERDAASAERAARELLGAAPDDPRPALILASALRRQGDVKGARAILAPLAERHPNAALTHYELGLSLVGIGDLDAGCAAFRRATHLNRDLAEAWSALGEALFRAGDARGAEAAFAEERRSRVRDVSLRAAAEAICAGRLDEAEPLLRRLLEARPRDAELLAMLGQVRLDRAAPADAEQLLAAALALDPEANSARFNYVTALFHQRKGAEALPHLERLLAADPGNVAYRNLAAGLLGLVGEFDRALSLYAALSAEFGRQPLIWLNYGHTLRTVGRAAEALGAYRRAIALDASLVEAYLGLANFKVVEFTAAEVAGMRRAAEQPGLGESDRAKLEFALGKACEDAGADEAAFAHFAAGAALVRKSTPYDPAVLTDHVSRCRGLFTPQFFAARQGFGAEARDPIFIVGLPRSGSTLIEQILASHSAVEGTMELPEISALARRLGWMDAPSGSQGYADAVAGLDAGDARALGEAYIAATRVYRKQGCPFFVDKMPNNFQHLGLIHLILPNARVIDARRHPLAAGFSCFKQHFARGQAFTYDLGDLGRYYRDYLTLMGHFDEALPGRAHRVVYEEMVEHTEREVRRLLAYCGLEFEPACLAFHETERPVRTVSSEQVRRPIYKDGLDHWRRFEPWLGPLKEALRSEPAAL